MTETVTVEQIEACILQFIDRRIRGPYQMTVSNADTVGGADSIATRYGLVNVIVNPSADSACIYVEPLK